MSVFVNGKKRLVLAIVICGLFVAVSFSGAAELQTLESEGEMIPLVPVPLRDRDWNYWNNEPHMYAIPDGNVGIGTANPEAKLDVKNGAVLFDGNVGNTPASGPGIRLMWIPKKAAFRAGEVNGNEWDDENIGYNSVAIGTETIASGPGSTALGVRTIANGYASTAVGDETIATGYQSTAMGCGTKASGDWSTAMGWCTNATGWYSTAMGFRTRASGMYATAMGKNTLAEGDYSTAMGRGSAARGENSIAMGRGAEAVGDYSTALGRYMIVNGSYSVGIDLDDNSHTISDDNVMSIMGGKIGIDTVSPENTLHINGAINLDPVAEPVAPTTGFVLYCDSADGTLKAKASTGTITTLANQ